MPEPSGNIVTRDRLEPELREETLGGCRQQEDGVERVARSETQRRFGQLVAQAACLAGEDRQRRTEAGPVVVEFQCRRPDDVSRLSLATSIVFT